MPQCSASKLACFPLSRRPPAVSRGSSSLLLSALRRRKFGAAKRHRRKALKKPEQNLSFVGIGIHTAGGLRPDPAWRFFPFFSPGRKRRAPRLPVALSVSGSLPRLGRARQKGG